MLDEIRYFEQEKEWWLVRRVVESTAGEGGTPNEEIVTKKLKKVSAAYKQPIIDPAGTTDSDKGLHFILRHSTILEDVVPRIEPQFMLRLNIKTAARNAFRQHLATLMPEFIDALDWNDFVLELTDLTDAVFKCVYESLYHTPYSFTALQVPELQANVTDDVELDVRGDADIQGIFRALMDNYCSSDYWTGTTPLRLLRQRLAQSGGVMFKSEDILSKLTDHDLKIILSAADPGFRVERSGGTMTVIDFRSGGRLHTLSMILQLMADNYHHELSTEREWSFKDLSAQLYQCDQINGFAQLNLQWQPVPDDILGGLLNNLVTFRCLPVSVRIWKSSIKVLPLSGPTLLTPTTNLTDDLERNVLEDELALTALREIWTKTLSMSGWKGTLSFGIWCSQLRANKTGHRVPVQTTADIIPVCSDVDLYRLTKAIIGDIGLTLEVREGQVMIVDRRKLGRVQIAIDALAGFGRDTPSQTEWTMNDVKTWLRDHAPGPEPDSTKTLKWTHLPDVVFVSLLSEIEARGEIPEGLVLDKENKMLYTGTKATEMKKPFDLRGYPFSCTQTHVTSGMQSIFEGSFGKVLGLDLANPHVILVQPYHPDVGVNVGWVPLHTVVIGSQVKYGDITIETPPIELYPAQEHGRLGNNISRILSSAAQQTDKLGLKSRLVRRLVRQGPSDLTAIINGFRTAGYLDLFDQKKFTVHDIIRHSPDTHITMTTPTPGYGGIYMRIYILEDNSTYIYIGQTNNFAVRHGSHRWATFSHTTEHSIHYGIARQAVTTYMIPICELVDGDKLLKDMVEQCMIGLFETYNHKCQLVSTDELDEAVDDVLNQADDNDIYREQDMVDEGDVEEDEYHEEVEYEGVRMPAEFAPLTTISIATSATTARDENNHPTGTATNVEYEALRRAVSMRKIARLIIDLVENAIQDWHVGCKRDGDFGTAKTGLNYDSPLGNTWKSHEKVRWSRYHVAGLVDFHIRPPLRVTLSESNTRVNKDFFTIGGIGFHTHPEIGPVEGTECYPFVEVSRANTPHPQSLYVNSSIDVFSFEQGARKIAAGVLYQDDEDKSWWKLYFRRTRIHVEDHEAFEPHGYQSLAVAIQILAFFQQIKIPDDWPLFITKRRLGLAELRNVIFDLEHQIVNIQPAIRTYDDIELGPVTKKDLESIGNEMKIAGAMKIAGEPKTYHVDDAQVFDNNRTLCDRCYLHHRVGAENTWCHFEEGDEQCGACKEAGFPCSWTHRDTLSKRSPLAIPKPGEGDDASDIDDSSTRLKCEWGSCTHVGTVEADLVVSSFASNSHDSH